MWVSFMAPLIHNFKPKPEQTLKINICHVNINNAFTILAYVCLSNEHSLCGLRAFLDGKLLFKFNAAVINKIEYLMTVTRKNNRRFRIGKKEAIFKFSKHWMAMF